MPIAPYQPKLVGHPRSNPESAWVSGEQAHESLVDPELFEAVPHA